jgi:signal transduction histidine kinase
MQNYSFDNWFSLLSGFAIFIMGLRVYWLDTSNSLYQSFMVVTFLLFAQNLFFFEMDLMSNLAQVNQLRPYQEGVWNLTLFFIILTMWHYARQFAAREMKTWEKRWMQFSLVTSVVFIVLQVRTPYGHGELVLSESGRWTVVLNQANGVDLLRAGWALSCYVLSTYFAFLPYLYATSRQSRWIRFSIFSVFGLITFGSFIQNYVLTYFFAIPSILNENINVAIGAIFCGLMITNLQLHDLQSRYAVPDLLKTMTNWFILLDDSFNIRQVNEAFISQMGQNLKYWQNVNIDTVFTDEKWKIAKRNLVQLASNQTFNYEFEMMGSEQNIFLLFVITPLFQPSLRSEKKRKKGYVLVGTDLSVFKASEEKIKAYANELETSNEALERFAFIASHDLKEPIRNIGNFAGLLRRRLGANVSEDIQDFLNFIEQNVKGMNKLIEAVMTVSRLGQEELKLSAVDCEHIVKIARKNLERLIQETGAVLDVSRVELTMLKGDRELLQQLVQNLIENGIKYNKEKVPRVSICITSAVGEEYTTLRFEDNGIGIAVEFREQVFEMFKRLHSRADYAGTGIGLAICRRIVELHKGKIWIEDSQQGTGTAFVVKLPRFNSH